MPLAARQGFMQQGDFPLVNHLNRKEHDMTNTTDQETRKRPTKRLVQEKAFYKTDVNGRQVRQTETIEITRGWDEVGRESGKSYVSWANTTIPVLPDVDGKITLRTFEINYDES